MSETYQREVITRNSVVCINCLDRIESTHRHDFVTCLCGKVSVDGGLEYRRRVWADGPGFIETSIYRVEEVEVDW